jgi:hypothetical protein
MLETLVMRRESRNQEFQQKELKLFVHQSIVIVREFKREERLSMAILGTL